MRLLLGAVCFSTRFQSLTLLKLLRFFVELLVVYAFDYFNYLLYRLSLLKQGWNTDEIFVATFGFMSFGF